MSKKPSVLVVASRWWPLSARLAMALIRNGCDVDAVCPTGHPLHFVSDIGRIYPYRAINSLGSIRKAMIESRPDAIIPCDDGVVDQLHTLYRHGAAVRSVIERSLGSAEMYSTIESRLAFLSVASELGIRVPTTKLVRSVEDLSAWHAGRDRRSVIKVNRSCGGLGVRITNSLGESLGAWRELGKRPSAATAMKRLMIDRDPLALWAHHRYVAPEITVQDYVAGTPANSMMACREGEVLALVSVSVAVSEGATGAAIVVRPIEIEDLALAARSVARRLNLSGLHGLDYILQEGSGDAYLIEINPRSTQLGHLEFPGQVSPAAALSAALGGKPTIEPSRPILADTVAFFPQALLSNPKDIHILAGHHDVPWEEPDLVRELLRGPAPQRHWLSRLYHALRPIRRFEAMTHEGPPGLLARQLEVGNDLDIAGYIKPAPRAATVGFAHT